MERNSRPPWVWRRELKRREASAVQPDEQNEHHEHMVSSHKDAKVDMGSTREIDMPGARQQKEESRQRKKHD